MKLLSTMLFIPYCGSLLLQNDHGQTGRPG